MVNTLIFDMRKKTYREVVYMIITLMDGKDKHKRRCTTTLLAADKSEIASLVSSPFTFIKGLVHFFVVVRLFMEHIA